MISENNMDREPPAMPPDVPGFSYRFCFALLVAFVFAPIWLTITGLTYYRAHEMEIQWVFRQAILYLAIFGVITIVAPLIKLFVLRRSRFGLSSLSPKRLLLVTILETALIVASFRVTVWIVWTRAPSIGIDPELSGPWLFGAAFIVTSGLLSIAPNLLLARSDRTGKDEPRRIGRKITIACFMALIAPIAVTPVVAGFRILG